jgi:hypothetical protein
MDQSVHWIDRSVDQSSLVCTHGNTMPPQTKTLTGVGHTVRQQWAIAEEAEHRSGARGKKQARGGSEEERLLSQQQAQPRPLVLRSTDRPTDRPTNPCATTTHSTPPSDRQKSVWEHGAGGIAAAWAGWELIRGGIGNSSKHSFQMAAGD